MFRRALLAVLMLIAVPFAGCATDDGGDDGDGTVQVAWTQEPQDRDTGQGIDIAWELTGPEGEIQHTGLHWGNDSVSDPETPADYTNSSGIEEPAQVPGNYSTTVTIEEEGTYYFRAHIIVDGDHRWTPEVSIDVSDSGPGETPITVSLDSHSSQGTVNESLTVNWSLSGAPDEVEHTGFHWANDSVDDPETPADYSNSTGVEEPAQVPGDYNGTFTEDEAGTYYGRAHAIYNGQHYWSDEVSFEVEENGSTASGEDHEVEMLAAQFEPDSITVQPGDTVTWTNTDPATHTATTQDPDYGPNSGDVDSGDSYTWTVPADMPAGTYDYICTYHDGIGMTGEITVETA